jgi:soluble lytic murein transglycosylase-like protein
MKRVKEKVVETIIPVHLGKVKKGVNLACAALAGLGLVGVLTFSSFKDENNLEARVEKNSVSEGIGNFSKNDADIYINSVYKKYSVAKEINPIYIKAIISAESDYNPNAVSDAGARGLMQVMPETWKYYYPVSSFKENSLHPGRNIEVGIRHLSGIRDYIKYNCPYWNKLSYHRKLELITAAYNGGPARLKYRAWNISKMPKETREYVPKVMHKYRNLSSKKRVRNKFNS